MKVEKGDTVKIFYEGRFEDGTVFDSSDKGEYPHPLVFIAGIRQVIEGFDGAVLGMQENEEKEFAVEPEKGYGLYDDDLKKDVPLSFFQDVKSLQEGMIFAASSPDGKKISGKVVSIKDGKIVADFNHPLAGKKLIFKIKIVGVNKN